jgi:hypothetical protein
MLSLFILMTALVAAWSRGGMGAAQGLASRYSLFPLLGLVSVWLAWLQYVRPRHTVLVSSGAMLVALAISSTFGVFEKTRWQHQRVAMLLEYFQVTNGYASHAHIVHFLDDARRSRIYSAPAGKSLIGALHAEPTSETTESAQTEVRGCVDVFDGSYLLGWAHFPHLSAARQRLSIILKSTAGMWTIPATYYDRPDLDPVFHDGGNYLNSGFQVMLPLYDVPPGSYRIGILIRNGGQSGILWVEQVYVASSPSSRRLCSEG